MNRVQSLSSESVENETLEYRVHRLKLSDSLSESFWINSCKSFKFVIQMLDFYLNHAFVSSFGSECVYSSDFKIINISGIKNKIKWKIK